MKLERKWTTSHDLTPVSPQNPMEITKKKRHFKRMKLSYV